MAFLLSPDFRGFVLLVLFIGLLHCRWNAYVAFTRWLSKRPAHEQREILGAPAPRSPSPSAGSLIGTYTFDELVHLAKSDPLGFEEVQRTLMESELAQMPPQHRAGARSSLTDAQSRLAGAGTPRARLLVALATLTQARDHLQHGTDAARADLTTITRS